MRHRKKNCKLGRTASHRGAMFANMTCSLILEGTIKTTVQKAKELRKNVAKLITLAKRALKDSDDKKQVYMRKIISELKIKTGKDIYMTPSAKQQAAKKLLDEIAQELETRPGGYTRIIKTGFRKGDGAQMCVVQLLGKLSKTKKKEVTPTEETVPEEVPVVENAVTEDVAPVEEVTEETPVTEEIDVEEDKKG